MPLPGSRDAYFNSLDNYYNASAYTKICREFDISTNSDFRYRGGNNHVLGVVY